MTIQSGTASQRIPGVKPFTDDYIRQPSLLQHELDTFLLSASGWRKVFASHEESSDPSLSGVNKEIAAACGFAFSKYLRIRSEGVPIEIAVATDTRPTGPEIAGILNRVFLSENISVRFIGVAAAPEIMAYARTAKLTGFAYVTASHNPIGHNGLKFGLSDGGVIGGAEAQTLINAFTESIQDAARCTSIMHAANRVDDAALKAVYDKSVQWKNEAIEAYFQFTKEVVTGYADPEKQEQVLGRIRAAAERRGIGVVAELNGSARTLSIDEAFLKSLGIKVNVLNGKPGEIVHRIVPEGDSLKQCSEELERSYASDKGFLLGYVPDNDGDRGNIVLMNPKTGRGEILHAQEVFALCCVAELSYLVYSGKVTFNESGKAAPKVAVVVNDPTSLRIEAIAKAFDARVFRAEVGEANVVNLARDSRKSGFVVRILGEGSNGGNITYPSAVRDPIDTLSAFLKLLLLDSPDRGQSKPNGTAPGLFEIWCSRSGQEFIPGAGIPEIIATMPRFVTTDIYEPRAVATVRTPDQIALKERFEEVFSQEWDDKHEYLNQRFGIRTWEEINYEGINEVHGFGRSYRTGRQRGGLKILFKDDLGRGIAFIWMRGSSTEPVFRILADVRGDNPKDEEWLLDWHISMLKRAEAEVLSAARSGQQKTTP